MLKFIAGLRIPFFTLCIATYIFSIRVHAQPVSIDNGTIRILFERGPQPSLVVQVQTVSQGWSDVCTLDAKGLGDVRFFTTTPVSQPAHSDWEVLVPNARTLVLTKEESGRRLSRRLQLDSSRAIVHVSTMINLQGDELTEWVQDRWAFAQSAPLDFTWTPNLRPEADLRIAAHTFRAPAVILEKNSKWVALIPDLDTLATSGRPDYHTLDLNMRDSPLPVFSYGIERADPVSHVYYRHDPSMVLLLPAGPYSFAYDLLVGHGQKRSELLRMITSYQWKRYAAQYVERVLPQTLPFQDYARYAYPTLLEKREYLSFNIGDKNVGGFKALVAHKDYFRRPDPIVWNQVWFNGQRSAYGFRHYGKSTEIFEWEDAAAKMTALTLSAPQKNGLFPAIYAYEAGEWWGSVPRLNGGRRRIHIADAAWTATWLLWEHRDLAPDSSILPFISHLADFLVDAQLPSGAIPPWFDLDEDTRAPVPAETLRESAETGSAALFLSEMALATGNESYQAAALRAADFLIREILPRMKYWDFETFFSCSWKSLDMEDPYTEILPQNTYSMYWAAHTLLRAYELTSRQQYLEAAYEVVGVLNLYQQIWKPPFLNLYTFGGFGVMNTDGEWNDSRQAVFAPFYLEFYRITGEPEFFERGVAALRASFALMSIPENQEVSPRTFDAYETGLMPENYAHGGTDGTHGRSDTGWGEAGALAAAAWIERHFGGIYVDSEREQAFGIDGCRVVGIRAETNKMHLSVLEQLGRDRIVTLVTSTGRRQPVNLQSGTTVNVTVER